MKLSIIIPFCLEWPQVIFTIRSLAEELIEKVDFEIIAIDNYCDEVKKQGRKKDRASEYIPSLAKKYSWLKYLRYSEKLSHWNAKRVGVENSSGDILLFIDAHCVPGRNSIVNAFSYYAKHYKELNGTLHLPLTYHILETQKLIYTPVISPQDGIYHYKFINFPEIDKEIFEVKVMSSCGMFMTKDLYDFIGGWPKELGIYGGGENFVNYVLDLFKKKKWIYSNSVLYHHGDERGYRFNARDYYRNRLIAVFLVFGKSAAVKYSKSQKDIKFPIRDLILNEVLHTCAQERKKILEKLKSLDK